MHAEKPLWAQYLPHGLGILLLEDCVLHGEHEAKAHTVLRNTPLGTRLSVWPSLWGLEILAQAAACMPVQGRIDGPRQGYLVKADRVRYTVSTLPADQRLEISVKRTAESATGLNVGEGSICLASNLHQPLMEARFYLWNKGA